MEGDLAGRAIQAVRKSAFSRYGLPQNMPHLICRLTGRDKVYQDWLVLQRLSGKSQNSLDQTIVSQLETLTDRIVIELDRLSLAGVGGSDYDKRRIDALSAMLRISERVEKIVSTRAKSSKEKENSDEDLATSLALVDARILELACELAAAMGGQTYDTEDGSNHFK